MKKYTVVFAVAYLILAVICAVTAEALKLKAGASLNLAATLAASFVAAWRFTRTERRLPSAAEKASFARQGLLSVWAVSLLLVAIFLALLVPAAQSIAILGLAGSGTFLLIGVLGAVVVSVLYYFAIRWSFSWFAKRSYEA